MKRILTIIAILAIASISVMAQGTQAEGPYTRNQYKVNDNQSFYLYVHNAPLTIAVLTDAIYTISNTYDPMVHNDISSFDFSMGFKVKGTHNGDINVSWVPDPFDGVDGWTGPSYANPLYKPSVGTVTVTADGVGITVNGAMVNLDAADPTPGSNLGQVILKYSLTGVTVPDGTSPGTWSKKVTCYVEYAAGSY